MASMDPSCKQLWSKVLLFGDSLTQNSFDPEYGCWGAFLAHRLQRKCDVISRGFSGYNSRWCALMLENLFTAESVENVSCFIVCLGANDSWNPRQQSHLIKVGVEKSKIILVTPPPYFHEQWAERCRLLDRALSVKTNETTKLYAEACVRVGEQLDIEVLDIFNKFNSHEKSSTLFCDGLHFSFDGAKFLVEILWPLVEKRVISYHKTMDMNFPLHSDINCDNPEESLL